MDEQMTAALRRPVLLRAAAESIGEVKGFVVDHPPRSVVALHVAGRGNKATLVDWQHLAFGPDAVIVDEDHSLRPLADDDEAAQVKRHRASLLGARVLTTTGFERGTVTDVEFDTASGAILRIFTGDHEWSGDQVCALGSWALVVRDIAVA